MVDYVKFELPLSHESELRQMFSFFGEVDRSTAEVRAGSEKAVYNNMEFRITLLNILVTGSLHKLHNILNGQGEQNFNDFMPDDLNQVITHLESEFGFSIRDAKLQGVELGVNIATPILPRDFLDQHLIAYDFRKGSIQKDFNGRGRFTEYVTTRYYLKIYSKQDQYGTPEPILRIEIKSRRMDFLNKIGIKVLGDLVDREKIWKAKQFLLHAVDKLLILDSLNLVGLPTNDVNHILRGTHSAYWAALKTEKSASTVYRQKRRYHELLGQYRLLGIHDRIKTLVDQKVDHLLRLNDRF